MLSRICGLPTPSYALQDVVQTLRDKFASSVMTSSERMPWGSLPLESYVLAQWTSLATGGLDQRRRQLAQQFTAIGDSGRYVDACHKCDFTSVLS